MLGRRILYFVPIPAASKVPLARVLMETRSFSFSSSSCFVRNAEVFRWRTVTTSAAMLIFGPATKSSKPLKIYSKRPAVRGLRRFHRLPFTQWRVFPPCLLHTRPQPPPPPPPEFFFPRTQLTTTGKCFGERRDEGNLLCASRRPMRTTSRSTGDGSAFGSVQRCNSKGFVCALFFFSFRTSSRTR